MSKFTKLRFTWVVAVLLTVGLLFVTPALADDENENTGAGSDQAQQELQDALDQIAANRATVESDLAQRCASAWGEEVDHVSATLAGLNDMDLLAADDAPDCDAVRSVIEGELLGDALEDWVYTAVNPCIIVDTRFAGGPIAVNTSRNYQVFGNLGFQGGQNCPLPKPGTEPRGVHINMVAIPTAGKGNVRAFPYLAPSANGLSANFQTINNVNVANAGTIKSCYFCGPEITVRTGAAAGVFAAANVKIEVLGYYFPAENPDGSDYVGGDQRFALSSADSVVRSISITAPTSGKVIVNASGSVEFGSGLRDSARCTITTGFAVDTLRGIYAAEETGGSSAVRWMPFAGTRGFNVSPGTTTFRLVCDEFAGTVYIVDSHMTAIFTRNTR